MPPSAPGQPHDVALLQRALRLAEGAIGLSDPNPRVGCVIVSAAGRLIGEGHTQHAGGPHAEVMALRSAAEATESTQGATAYVSLEPCSHHGRTPPCCDALINAGITRVVIACKDPNPLVAGRGVERLRAAGIVVDEVAACRAAARELNIGFFSRMLRDRPWVRMKIAASLDGRTALDNGSSQWITGVSARTDGHAWRKRAGAVLTGVGTVLEDDPRLDVRLVETSRQPLRVIVDSRLETPLSSRILDAPGNALIFAANDDMPARADALRERGAETAFRPGAGGKVDLIAVLSELSVRGINELHVEAGHKLNGSFVREGLVDEFLIYIAPKLIGQGRGATDIGPLTRLDEAVGLQFHAVDRIGDDLRILARPAGKPPF